MLNTIYFNNLGYIESKLPDNLFLKIKKEISKIKTENIKEYITGLTGNGVPKHYSLNKNLKELNEFLQNLIIEFDKVMPASSSSAGIQVIDSSGNTTSLTNADPGVRTDMHEWTSNYPTIETRSIQVKINMSSALNGIRRITVFYTPKE